MCGISGIISFRKTLEEKDFTSLEKSISTLNKRGPDYQGTHIHDSLGFAHARLSIIDNTSRANQPFFDESKRFVIIFNGEIYNSSFAGAKILKKLVFSN